MSPLARMRAPLFGLGLGLCSMAGPACHSPAAPQPPTRAKNATPSVPAAPLAPDLYLTPESAQGFAYCLDPSSEALGRSLQVLDATLAGPLERAALAADVDFLHGLLRKLYSGYPELVQHPRFDVEAFFARWAETVRSGSGPVSFEAGVVDWLLELGAVHSDRHLMPIGGYGPMLDAPAAQISEFVGPLPDAEPPLELGDCALVDAQPEPDSAYDWVPDTLRRTRGVDAQGRRSPAIAVSVRGLPPDALWLACDAQRLELRRRAPAAPGDDGPVYEWHPHGDTAIIRIRRFWGDDDELARLAQLAQDYAEHQKFERIVFDVRGNSGGDDSYLFEWIAAAKRGPWSTGPVINLEGSLGPCRQWNPLVTDQILNGEVDSPSARAERDELRASWSSEGPSPALSVHDGLVEDQSEHPYAGSIFVITDRDTASSGESVPAYLRAAFGAHVIGERSAGFMDYGNVLPFVLPHTGLWVQVPTTRFYNDPPAEVVGVPVDTYLDPIWMDRPAEALLPVLEGLEGAPLPGPR